MALKGMNYPLTRREADVLAGMMLGQNNKEIAQSLGSTEDTVKVHVKAIFRKLRVNSRTQAVSLCLRAALALPCPRCGYVDDTMSRGDCDGNTKLGP